MAGLRLGVRAKIFQSRRFQVLASLLVAVSASPAPQKKTTGGLTIATFAPCTDTNKPHSHIIATPNTTVVAGLQVYVGSTPFAGRATLTGSGYISIWNFGNGGVAFKKDCQPPAVWLNIDPVATEYKPLYWNGTQITTTWATAYGSDLVAKATAEYDTTSTFLACKPFGFSDSTSWYLFLVTPHQRSSDFGAVAEKLRCQHLRRTRLTLEVPTSPPTPPAHTTGPV